MLPSRSTTTVVGMAITLYIWLTWLREVELRNPKNRHLDPLIAVARDGRVESDPEASVSLQEAEALLPAPTGERLVRAGRCGLADPELARLGGALTELAIEGARRYEPDAGAAIEVAEAFRARFTGRGVDPGTEEAPDDPFAI